ncbi:SWIM zinc finger family protein [Actinophytocola sp.]|uniref:SWIM zinc finger family protein n=1 Tax=Actinophytocola sp. TaxID=1872138 RepID=UPI003D6BA513
MIAWFTEDDLHEAAGGQSYQRGRDYVDAVADVAPTALGVRATVRGMDTYEVWLGRHADGVVGECSCPFGADGNFCKHCVAVGLVLLADGPGPAVPEVDLGAYLRTLDPRELVELVLEQAGRDPALYRRLSLRAGTTGAPQVAVLRRQLDEALRARGYLDDRATREYARRAREVLDMVDELIVSGHASEARPLARAAVEGITAAMSTVDDSSGAVTGACRRAMWLYARACAVARPNPARLAEWVFRLRLDGPGWPVVELADFAEALGETGMAAYRSLLRETCVAPPEYKVVVLRSMREQLATVDGDLDVRVDILAENVPNPKAFLDIVALLREAGELAGAIRWAERGVAETGDPRLADALVESYVDAERPGDAVAVRESAVRSAPTRLSYANLRATASDVGSWPAVREAALDVLRAAAEREERADELAGALLDDGETAEAWLAAGKHGCRDRAWLEVARAHGAAHPAEVLPGYREAVHRCLERTGRDAYREVAVLLEELRDLSARCGELAACEALVGWIRERHHRRRALLTELARRGL